MWNTSIAIPSAALNAAIWSSQTVCVSWQPIITIKLCCI